MDESKKKMIDTLITSVNDAQTQIPTRTEVAAKVNEYVRNAELSFTATFAGIASEDTVPIQPGAANVIYIAVIQPDSSVTLRNFKDATGRPVSIIANGNNTLFALLLWNKHYWDYQFTSTGFMLSNVSAPGTVRPNDNLLPRVAPNASLYGYFSYLEQDGYHAHQSIAYDSMRNELLFGVSNSYEVKSEAYLYITNMMLKEPKLIKLPNAYTINDMAFGSGGRLMIATKDPGRNACIVSYAYPNLRDPVYLDFTSDFGKTPIDALCYTSESGGMNILKGGNKIVLYGANFMNKKGVIEIDPNDMHGDEITSQTIEYYKGYILVMNAGEWNETRPTKNAYLNVYRIDDGSKVETYRYPDSTVNMHAQGICSIGNGKYLFTHYGGPRIEVRQLDFNTPSHTHILSDIFDLKDLEKASKDLYVNPWLEGTSYLAPDGSKEKPFPNVAEAVAYAKVFQPEATVYLMDGNYGTVELSNVPTGLTFKGLSKDACLIDKLRISKCRDLLFEDLTFCDSEWPFEATSSTIELNNCSFPNGKQSGPEAAGTCGVRIARNSTVTLKECEISHFDAAVDIRGSRLFLEGSKALRGTGNRYGIRGEKSIIWGSKDLSEKVFTEQGLSLNGCQPVGDYTPVRNTKGAIRPSGPEKGGFYFDVGANKPLWWNGADWVDITGKVN